ncbi:flavin oxidoreductase [Aphanothece hegewaldii CCALA 016]|uniref:Flavin oxidoreductase n=1 Tax=Aphanothece hegewaldii CCALA 016 TaxID=2107694 RepID=A0A2T1LW08_9CHRO|nr:diflavin flavoprotein [Aphanothece hegewaldii]PSF36051.1 flavin oxidoreductase [Aphanothece hegewaldii CCALA 016]
MMTLTPTHTRDVQIATIGHNTIMVRSRTWERLKFEVEYSRQRGTTANSYLIQGDQIALIDPPGVSFTEIFIEELSKTIDLNRINYIILSHVNPNRLITLKALLEKLPQVTLICSRPGANILKTALKETQSIRCPETLDLGQGHHLQFITVPTPRWPDGLCTYDPATELLYTDKLFGVHICEDSIIDEDWKALDSDRLYYFDCLHAPQAKQVEDALDKLSRFSVKGYAPGHGCLVRHSISRLTYDYRYWCGQQKRQDFKVALLYASAYGNTATLANAIAQGLIQNGVEVESINCELANSNDILQAVETCDGFILGSPTLGGHAPVQIQTALGIILSSGDKTKLAGVFGSYGWSGEAIDLLETKLQDANYRFGFAPIRVRFSPTSDNLEQCYQAGTEFVQALKRNKKIRSPRISATESQINRTEQAVGRIIGSLCVITTQNGNSPKGILTSWVSQASFNPPGLMIAVAEDQNADLMRHTGDKFVLNILSEGRNVRRYFSRHSSLGSHPFSEIPTKTAENGCMILSEALAYLECRVERIMACGDRWLIYAIIEKGEVILTDGVSAIEHRKSAGY